MWLAWDWHTLSELSAGCLYNRSDIHTGRVVTTARPIERSVMPLIDLSEAETVQIEQQRVLALTDPVFVQLPIIRAERDRIMVARAKHNRNGASVMSNIFYALDQSAYHRARDPLEKLAARCQTTEAATTGISNGGMEELIDDLSNYADMWLACRKCREHGAEGSFRRAGP